MLRSQRKILPAQKQFMNQMGKAGIKPAHVFNFFEEGTKGIENVGFLRMDCNNYISGQRAKYLHGQDTQTLLEYLQMKRKEDPSFFYSIQVHESGQIANFFWADGRSIVDYAYFGDVISFDTTFQTNKYDMSLAPLLGVNNHKQTVIFGAALLCDETTESFIWLFQTFLSCMCGKEPITIFTDQSAAMAKAISSALPNTCHRLCLWHIFQNANTNLGHIISKFPEFSKVLKDCAYEARSIENFVARWEDMLRTYNLEENAWLQNLYCLREKWAEVFRRDSFCANMRTTQRSESMNSHLKQFFHKKLSLSELLKEYDRALKHFREKELYEDYKSRQTKSVPFLPDVPLLITAANVYTRTLYKEFEDNCKKAFASTCQLLVFDELSSTTKVSILSSTDEEVVILNKEDHIVQCTCRRFEYYGILCAHALKVLYINNIVDLPNRYILRRWTKYAKDGIALCVPQSMVGDDASTYARVCHKALSVAAKSSNCKEALIYLEKGLNALTLGVEKILHESIIGNEKSDDTFDASIRQTIEIDTIHSHITVKPPPLQKGRKEKRKRSILERKKRNPKKNNIALPQQLR
ncbi:protein FAR1-RELATED SEQUENCE 5-like [Ananas comosus]|uniref:Protein FAR1-RELATED SEQUENCE 5-like n=1 Tax=Ananas comosus TaxID=4615 RepID=A0A6P5GJF6_ANACO|nr:protein FAR1-RELATED SEQUENCE 5-like [Ananas comosus]